MKHRSSKGLAALEHFATSFHADLRFGPINIMAMLLILLAVVWFLPTSQAWLSRYAQVAVAEDRADAQYGVGRAAAYATLLGVALAAGVLAVPHASEFIYFRF